MPGRYEMQERFGPWGPQGQSRLRQGRAVVVGIGGLGGLAAMLLVRAGIGSLRLVDPDYPSLDNLHRQVLYGEADVTAGRPKVQAAAAYLAGLNSEVAIEPRHQALEPDNALDLLADCQVVIDCLDNPVDRCLLNEACLYLGIPLVHAGVVRSKGQLVVVRPGQGPCLRCWFPTLGQTSVDVSSQGVIGPAAACLSSLQASEALKILVGAEDKYALNGMLAVELWPPRFVQVQGDPAAHQACPACRGRYERLKLDGHAR